MWRSWFTLQLGCGWVQDGTACPGDKKGDQICGSPIPPNMASYGSKPFKTLVPFLPQTRRDLWMLADKLQHQHAQHSHAETVVVGETLAELDEAKWRIQRCRVQIWQVRRKWSHGDREWEKVKDPNWTQIASCHIHIISMS